MGKLKNAYIKLRNKYNQWHERRKLKSTDFSIISNNCWANFIVLNVPILISNNSKPLCLLVGS